MSSADIKKEIARRRTFAIISHPDAGKTTITEKILYIGGAIREAGEVKGKKGTKAATSDWMTMEKERGVSITSSVMQFDFQDLRINLLDTPGHKDFGEDTYRTLIAADSAAMLIDAAKGVEIQTRKLYEVCRLRKIPIFTFANKMDREGKDPLELIDDVENTLGIKCYPVTWPIGMGGEFKGLYHRLQNKVYYYEKGKEEPEIKSVTGWQDNSIKERVGERLFDKLQEDMELLELALGPFDKEEFLAGRVSPMTFGSAKYTWGVDLFLELFAQHSPPPMPRKTTSGELVDPYDDTFSGFVFKIQANMDRKHRDRVAFVRICSGKFERGMKVKHARLNREIRLAYANQFMAKDRETVEEAYTGDIVGVNDSGNFQIGDSIFVGTHAEFLPMPRFSPEVFAKLNIKDPLKRKALQKALQQLSEEGMVQMFFDPFYGKQDPILGVVGELQFDVLLFRLNDEYGLEVKLERQPYSVARWPVKKDGKLIGSAIHGGTKLYMDHNERPVVLLAKEWDLNWLLKENPDLEFKFTGE
ncbi:MAG: peptide chain release factor 3 [Bdellovibrionaceae bacterium]|nr:peptide chain release factor 3 [Pseudobdellovibrionaceae bacterium]